jgi:hypothetical protein
MLAYKDRLPPVLPAFDLSAQDMESGYMSGAPIPGQIPISDDELDDILTIFSDPDSFQRPDLLGNLTHFLQKKKPLSLPPLLDLGLPSILIDIAGNSPDPILTQSALSCLSIWPYALSDMTDLLLQSGYCDLILHFLSLRDRSFDRFILRGLRNLILYCPPFRPSFLIHLPIASIFVACDSIDPVTALDLATLFDAIVRYLPISEPIVDYSLRVFSLIFIQKMLLTADSDAQLYALSGVMHILQSSGLPSILIKNLVQQYQIAVFVHQFLLFPVVTKELVYASLIVAHLLVLGVEEAADSIDAMLEVLHRESIWEWYDSVVSGFVQIVKIAPDGVLGEFFGARLLPTLVGIIPRAQYQAQVKICECIFLIVERVGLENVCELLDGEFFGLLAEFLDGDDDVEFVSQVILGIHSILSGADRLGLADVSESVRGALAQGSPEILAEIAMDETLPEEVVAAARDIVNFMGGVD